MYHILDYKPRVRPWLDRRHYGVVWRLLVWFLYYKFYYHDRCVYYGWGMKTQSNREVIIY